MASMTKQFSLAARFALSLALAACDQAGPVVGNQAVPRPSGNLVSPTQRRAVAAQPACAPAPTLVLSAGFIDASAQFAPDAPVFLRIRANFAAAYRGACAQGFFRRRAFADAGAAHPDQLFLLNAPEANVASVYMGGEESGSAVPRTMILEYAFLTEDGHAHVPTAAELREAIYCHVHGASAQEENASGRCLAD